MVLVCGLALVGGAASTARLGGCVVSDGPGANVAYDASFRDRLHDGDRGLDDETVIELPAGCTTDDAPSAAGVPDDVQLTVGLP